MIIKGKSLKQITSLNLSGKDLKDIPIEVFECTNLRKLNLSNNNINRIPLNIKDLHKLEVLNLAGNKLDQLHSGLFQLVKLKRLVLANNSIKSLPNQIENLIRLEVLMVQNNKLISINPNHLTHQIRKLNFANNNISEISWINNLPNLKQVWFGGNPFYQSEVKSFPSLVI